MIDYLSYLNLAFQVISTPIVSVSAVMFSLVLYSWIKKPEKISREEIE